MGAEVLFATLLIVVALGIGGVIGVRASRAVRQMLALLGLTDRPPTWRELAMLGIIVGIATAAGLAWGIWGHAVVAAILVPGAALAESRRASSGGGRRS